jgi:uncharacterized protein involved in outer membrane biogenesis
MGKVPAQTSRKPAARVRPKGRLGKLLITIILGIFTLIAVAYLNRNFLIKTAVEIGVRKALGMKVSITELKLDLFPGRLEIKGLTVYNPPGFEGESLAKIPKIAAEFELLPFLGGKFQFRNLELNIYEISIIKNTHKELNLNRIQTIAAAGSGPSKTPPPNSKPASIRIDQLILTVDHVKYMDYSKSHPKENRIWLGIYRERFYNLRSIDDIVRVVVVKVVLKAGLNNIGLPFRNLSSGIRHVGKSIQTGVKKSSTGVGNFFKKINPLQKK